MTNGLIELCFRTGGIESSVNGVHDWGNMELNTILEDLISSVDSLEPRIKCRVQVSLKRQVQASLKPQKQASLKLQISQTSGPTKTPIQIQSKRLEVVFIFPRISPLFRH
jgi:hypothetical protein